jgi:hypothetical protein
MRFSPAIVIGVPAVALTCLALAAAGQVSGQSGEVVPVAVTNFPELVKVDGSVAIKGPIQETTLSTLADVVVPPVRREDTTHFVDAGTVATDGFAFAVVSVLGELKGQLQKPGDIGAILLPDDDRVLRALGERGQLLLAEEAKVTPTAGPSPYFATKPVRFAIAYPRYRVFLYNAGDKSAAVTVHTYLTN